MLKYHCFCVIVFFTSIVSGLSISWVLVSELLAESKIVVPFFAVELNFVVVAPFYVVDPFTPVVEVNPLVVVVEVCPFIVLLVTP